jgi:nitrous oxide reductase accessory protein NosL
MSSRRLVILGLFLIASAAAACAPTSNESNPAPAPVAATSWVPVAGYLGSDEAAGTQVAALLKAKGIESVAAGSLGTTVNASSSDAEHAREILRVAIADGTLHGVTIYYEAQ